MWIGSHGVGVADGLSLNCMTTEPDYRLSDHAREEAQRRDIPLEMLIAILQAPEQIVDAHSGRKIYQSRFEFEGRPYLVRAVVALTDPLTVITVYRTSKIEKYWSDKR